ncbi:MAG: lipid-A-disaccharide synthase [Pseudomonadota bacterium]|jgi:lipid-A-disaccharide synthase
MNDAVPATRPLRVVIVAGEASGDQLGAALMQALRARFPAVQFAGIGGPRMRAAGCECWHDAATLTVMGLVEVLPHLPRLLRIRRQLIARVLALQPDVYIGVDFKEFNLSVARRLKARGVRTVQYVSPQVWAWREGRARTIGQACDEVLCLLPFEPAFYQRFGVQARFVGHPLADEIPLEADRAAARAALGLSASAPVLALLPGSRAGEVGRLGADFVAAARLLLARHPGLQCVAPMAGEGAARLFREAGAEAAGIRLLDGQARVALQAADVALVASGTASLEALLCRCPMVVAYRLGGITALLLRWLRLVKLAHFSLPNLLAGEGLVPEFFQGAVTPAALAAAVETQMAPGPGRERQLVRFRAIHESLRQGGAARAADAIAALVGR